MRNGTLKSLLLLFFCLASWFCDAQNIDLKYIEFAANKVVMHYDLLDSVEGRSYSVRLYSSVDGFLNALEKINGDAGLEVKSGKNKKLEWAASEELGASFEGRVALEIRARIFIPFINTESIDKSKTYKRHRKYNLTWSGGTPQNILNFDLIKGDKKVYTFPNLSNVGHSTFEFTNYIRPGKNYRFRISDSKNKEEVVFTQTFRIKRKVPMLLKVIPGFVIAAGVYLVTSKKAINDDITDPPLK
jgi:hypothetical protein